MWPTPLDDRKHLLESVGSLWEATYLGNDLVASLLFAQAQCEKQTHAELEQLLASVNRFSVEPRLRRDWFAYTIVESQRNQRVDRPRFDGRYRFDGAITFDHQETLDWHVWPLPKGLVRVPIVCSQLYHAPVVWIDGIDFFVADGHIWFLRNPLEEPSCTVQEIWRDDGSRERECRLWLYGSVWENQAFAQQWVYPLDMQLPYEANAKQLVNAIYDIGLEGCTELHLLRFFSALCDVPLAQGDEQVEYILDDSYATWVITDKNAYRLQPNSTPTVSIGQKLTPGTTLDDALQLWHAHRGSAPPSSAVAALTIPKEFLGTAYRNDLIFRNQSFAVQIDTVAGKTRLRFPIDGHPDDVDRFWDEVHRRGYQSQTLAELLDTRPPHSRVGQPGPLALPATINPLQFLWQHLLRNHFQVIQLKPDYFGPAALCLSYAKVLRKLLPPHSCCLLLVQLQRRGETVDAEHNDEQTGAGVNQDVKVFFGNTLAEEIDPADFVEETVRCGGYRPRCFS